MEGDVVEDNDIALFQGRRQLRFHPDLEGAPVHRAIDDPGGGQAMAAQGRDAGLAFPASERRVGPVALSFLRPAGALGQLGVGGGFVDETQPRHGLVEEGLAPCDPKVALGGDVRSLLLAGQQAFFYG